MANATWVKLYGSTLDSSIWGEDHAVVRVWMTMLMMADWHGYVGASVGGLARRARVDREDCERALSKFLGPDADSRDGTAGERIQKVDRGWLVLNVEKYRDERTGGQIQQAERVKKWRAKRTQSGTDEDRDLDKTKKKKKTVRTRRSAPEKDSTEGFAEFWDAYDKKRSRQQAEKAWGKIRPDADLRAKITDAVAAYVRATPDKQYRKDPATWLNGECWEDEVVARPRASGNRQTEMGDFSEFGDNPVMDYPEP